MELRSLLLVFLERFRSDGAGYFTVLELGVCRSDGAGFVVVAELEICRSDGAQLLTAVGLRYVAPMELSSLLLC